MYLIYAVFFLQRPIICLGSYRFHFIFSSQKPLRLEKISWFYEKHQK